MRPVVFDIDGVLSDFYRGYSLVARALGRPDPQIGRWNDFLDPVVWGAIEQSTDFWLMLPPRVSRHVFRRINSLRDDRDVYFATSRVGRHPLWQTTEWLESMGVAAPSVIVTSRKGEFAKVVDAAWLLDDKAGNAVYTAYESPKTQACLLDAPYNQFNHAVLGGRVLRVDTVEEFIDLTEEEDK